MRHADEEVRNLMINRGERGDVAGEVEGECGDIAGETEEGECGDLTEEGLVTTSLVKPTTARTIAGRGWRRQSPCA